MNKLASRATNMGARMASNGYWNVNVGWLKSINYTISGSYTDKKSYYEEQASNAMSLYSTAMGNSTISNHKGATVTDADGNVLTSFADGDENAYATVMPYSYMSYYDIYGKEVNAYGKVVANFFTKFGPNINNRIIVGAV